jgi:hypothetical protein
MQPKLRLVRDSGGKREHAGADEEVRFRYPAREEIWEVSCEPDWEGDEKPTTHSRNERRAS